MLEEREILTGMSDTDKTPPGDAETPDRPPAITAPRRRNRPDRPGLDPDILRAARRADPKATIAVRGALTAERAAVEAITARDEAMKAANLAEPRVVVVGGSSQKRRRTKFTPQVREEFLDLLRQAVPKHRAMKELGITAGMVREAVKNDPEFGEEMNDAGEAAMEPLLEAAWRNGKETGDPRSIELAGRILAPWLYSPDKKIGVAVSGQIESVDAGGRAAQIERIRALETRLAERLALRAGGDEIEAQIEDADVVEDGGERGELEH